MAESKNSLFFTLLLYVLAWMLIGGISYFFYSVAPMRPLDQAVFWGYFFAIPLALYIAVRNLIFGVVLWAATFFLFNYVLMKFDFFELIAFWWPLLVSTVLFVPIIVVFAVVSRLIRKQA
jgi:hypothetical protein